MVSLEAGEKPRDLNNAATYATSPQKLDDLDASWWVLNRLATCSWLSPHKT
eukprot:CAMPEP_0195580824 /NCGR_PEP_ID=MMETSP0814-20130614/18922_1 /TAXON_ID=97485 /ORGANISM="Prymnesium parvum, Strain Texoma1" /LENGTH=50 /DNA_ID=CAMNT_0040718057 /DNA_START=506 /DNA_END=655 /DNA_ORIENTATION=-